MECENIIIVNDRDESIGSMEKMLVHQNGILHRAFSILLFDEHGNMLIQKRSKLKYHSPLLWANACCSHQRSGESMEEAINRRLYEELLINDVSVTESLVMHYRYQFSNSLIENEIDHIYVGTTANRVIYYNADEVDQVEWVNLDCLKSTINDNDKYAYWFQLIINKLFMQDNHNEFDVSKNS